MGQNDLALSKQKIWSVNNSQNIKINKLIDSFLYFYSLSTVASLEIKGVNMTLCSSEIKFIT